MVAVLIFDLIIMKTPLKISLVLNAGLLAGLIFVIHGMNPGKPPAAATLSSGLKVETPVATAAGLAPATPIQPRVEQPCAEPASFRWSQLQANDYHVYVKNLRAIGCPEPSVRAIVLADVQAVFRLRIQEIKKELANLDQSSWPAQVAAAQTEAALNGELKAMPDLAAAEVADLLGLPPTLNQMIAAVVPPPLVPPPLVLQPVDISALSLSQDEMDAITNIQQEFVDQLGSTNQDSNDPAYRARWQAAQHNADIMLQNFLGINDYTKYQTLANQLTLEQQEAQMQ
jgi:hypothetical protein